MLFFVESLFMFCFVHHCSWVSGVTGRGANNLVSATSQRFLWTSCSRPNARIPKLYSFCGDAYQVESLPGTTAPSPSLPQTRRGVAPLTNWGRLSPSRGRTEPDGAPWQARVKLARWGCWSSWGTYMRMRIVGVCICVERDGTEEGEAVFGYAIDDRWLLSNRVISTKFDLFISYVWLCLWECLNCESMENVILKRDIDIRIYIFFLSVFLCSYFKAINIVFFVWQIFNFIST